MRAVALLGPNANSEDVAEFAAAARCSISIHSSITDTRDAALIFGGDGTVHRHLRALVETKTPAMIVPAGSGNDFARAIGTGTRARALESWRTFCDDPTNTRFIDVGEISAIPDPPSAVGHRPSTADLFCCVAGAGIDSETNRRANAMPRWLRARGGYALSVVGAALAFRPVKMRVEYEDENGVAATIEDQAMMCAFANAPMYGHGMNIAPRAAIDDALLDLVFVRRAGAARLLTLFPSVYFGGHMGLREVIYKKVRRLRIVSDPPLEVYADGEFICRTPADVSVRPKVLQVIAGAE